MQSAPIFERPRLQKELEEFISSPGAGFLYLRGRRRIGKSWLLSRLKGIHSKVFLFSGALDADNRNTLKEFARAWDSFTGTKELTRLKTSELGWRTIFDCISKYGHAQLSPVVIALDEIQWIASGRSGFIGALKAAWVEWERSARIKVIVCGSSTRFFSKFTGGESKVLRGLHTRSDILVDEIPLTHVRQQLLPDWAPAQVVFLYMLTGGVPYYLQQIDPKAGFIHALNRAFFCAQSIFLDEWNELLCLDYNKRGMETAAKILSALFAEQGQTLSEIASTTGLSDEVVYSALVNLQQYAYVIPRMLLGSAAPQERNTGVRYLIQDSYLDFYFAVLRRNEIQIRDNHTGLLFPRLTFYPDDTLHVPNFSGHAFERVVAKVLRDQLSFPSSLATKLQLVDKNFDLYRGIQVKNAGASRCEIDILLVHRQDRTCRVIECKWASTQDKSHLAQLIEKQVPAQFADLNQKKILVTLYTPTKDFSTQAQSLGITLVGLSDLLGE